MVPRPGVRAPIMAPPAVGAVLRCSVAPVTGFTVIPGVYAPVVVPFTGARALDTMQVWQYATPSFSPNGTPTRALEHSPQRKHCRRRSEGRNKWRR